MTGSNHDADTPAPWYNRAPNGLVERLASFVTWPGQKLRDLTAGFRERNKSVYYHRKFREVTPFEDCEEDDALCIYEANEQYNRNRLVDETILVILRQRMMECALYYGQDQDYKCKKEREDFREAETNLFAKYGDLGVRVNQVHEAFRKQQHRMIWERRNQKSLIDGKPLENDS